MPICLKQQKDVPGCTGTVSKKSRWKQTYFQLSPISGLWCL
jgi:hypothetical protein